MNQIDSVAGQYGARSTYLCVCMQGAVNAYKALRCLAESFKKLKTMIK